MLAGAVSDSLKACPALLLVGWRLCAENGHLHPHKSAEADPEPVIDLISAASPVLLASAVRAFALLLPAAFMPCGRRRFPPGQAVSVATHSAIAEARRRATHAKQAEALPPLRTPHLLSAVSGYPEKVKSQLISSRILICAIFSNYSTGPRASSQLKSAVLSSRLLSVFQSWEQ